MTERNVQHIDFDRLRTANVTRAEQVYHRIHDWSLTDWATAAAGEMGEACNIVKKLRRLESSSSFARPTERDADVLVEQLAGELADTVIYIDLLAARAGIDLGEAIRAKFNRTSERVDSGVWL